MADFPKPWPGPHTTVWVEVATELNQEAHELLVRHGIREA